MNWSALIWFILMVFFIAVESSTVVLVSLWFAIGALAAMVASLLGGQLWLQIVLFFGVSAGMLALLRPILRKHFTPKLLRTNVDAMIGSTGLVTVSIDNTVSQGQVKLGAIEWTARSATNEKIEAGTLIKVDRIEGVKVYVTPVQTPVEAK